MTPAENFIQPNSWVIYVEECGKELNRIRREEFSECYYEHVFIKYSQFLRDNLVDRGPTECEQDTMFDPNTGINDPDNKRPSCYPIETLYGFDTIPVDSNVQNTNGDPTSMLIVDQKTNIARWNKHLTPAMQGAVSRLIYAETDHDGD